MSASYMFSKKTRKVEPAKGLDSVVNQIKQALNGGLMASPDNARAALSMESINEGQAVSLDNAINNMSHALESIATSIGVSATMSQSQKDAATVAGIIAGDMSSFLHHAVSHTAVSTESMSVVRETGVADSFTKRSFGLEAYDEKDNRNAVAYSIAYNMQAARQDEFGETLFPTIVITPDTIGYTVSVRLIQVYNDLHRSVTGALDNFNKKNIIRAMIDSTILKNDLTKIIPVFRTQAAGNFTPVATIPSRSIMLEGESIPTSPLAFGKAFSLLGLSQTDTLLANGVMDSTDSIDPAVTLQSVYADIGDNVLKFNTVNLPLAVFSPAPQGLNRLMNLAFRTTSLLLTPATKNIDGSALTGALLGVVTGNLTVRVALTVTGDVNLETADTELNANTMRVVQVQDNTGAMLDLTQAPALAIVAAIQGGTMVGYDLQAYRTNLNRRQRGQLLDTSYVAQMYPVPLRSPITVARPVTTDGATDSSDLAALITATHVRTSNAAVAALLSARDVLAEYVDARDTAGLGPDVLGVGRHLVRPTYFSVSLDVAASIDSLSSHQRAADIQAILVSQIRDLAYRMYRDSGYKAASDAMSGGQSKAPTVIIATDVVLSRYLMVDGDLRTLGSDFDVRIVQTLDSRMQGKIAITFGQFDGSESTPNALHFGNMAWKPEVTVVMPISRGGQVSKELTVQPSFLHIVNCPVLAMVDVKNIPDIVASKVAVDFNAV